MWPELLLQMIQKMGKYGDRPQPACSTQAVDDVLKSAQEVLGVSLPDSYCSLLRTANGLAWNGMTIYAANRSEIVGCPGVFIDGLVEANLKHQSDSLSKKYVAYGEDSTSLFCLDRDTGAFVVVSIVGILALETYATFDELLTSVLRLHL